MNAELNAAAQQIERARSPEDVFGRLSGAPDEQLRAARLAFHRLAKIIHPDRYPQPAERMAAQRAM